MNVASPRSASEILRALAARPERHVQVNEIVAIAGSRVHGLAILVFALPETILLPLPSASAVLGVPLILVSAHLFVFAERAPLPAWVRARTVPHAVLAAIARYAVPPLECFERLSRPRWGWLARRERPIGFVCFLLSLVLFLPIPFVNAAPAIALSLVALGMIQRDGIIVAFGMLAALTTAAVMAGLIRLGGALAGF